MNSVTHSKSKNGGVLLGLIIALVVVAVLSAAMVRSLRSQAVTSTKAYNVMRARNAAESGYNYFASLERAEQVAFADETDPVEYSMKNGDKFTISVTTNVNYLYATIKGQALSGNSITATRPFKTRMPIGGSGGGGDDGTGGGDGGGELELNPDDMLNDAIIADLPSNEIDPGNKGNPLKDIRNKKIIKVNGKKRNKDLEQTYAKILALHEPFITEKLLTPLSSSLKLRTNLDARYATVDKDHLFWDVCLPLDLKSEAESAVTNNYLSYDAQLKITWQNNNRNFYHPYARGYGAQGIAFKLSDEEKNADKKDLKLSYYALTVMCYSDDNEKNNLVSDYNLLNDTHWGNRNLVGWNWNDGYWGDYDCIPNDIKPPRKAGEFMIVLWRNDGNKRTWIAYQELEGPIDDRWNRYVLDFLLCIRVSEGGIDVEKGGKKGGTEFKEYFDVQLFSGDGGGQASSPGDTIAYNQGSSEKRRRYYNASDLPDAYNTSFPTWPVASEDWSADVDYFTLASATQHSPRLVLNSKFNDAELLDDGETIRIFDEDSLYKNQKESNRTGELGLVFCGNFMSGIQFDMLNPDGELKVKNPDDEDYLNADIPSLYMAVDDVAIKWGMKGSSGGSGEETGTTIITDF